MTNEAKEIVEALRAMCSEQGNCGSCPLRSWCHAGGKAQLEIDAADLIESLAAELEQVKQERSDLSIKLIVAESALKKCKRERDAAIADMERLQGLICQVCQVQMERGSEGNILNNAREIVNELREFKTPYENLGVRFTYTPSVCERAADLIQQLVDKCESMIEGRSE